MLAFRGRQLARRAGQLLCSRLCLHIAFPLALDAHQRGPCCRLLFDRQRRSCSCCCRHCCWNPIWASSWCRGLCSKLELNLHASSPGWGRGSCAHNDLRTLVLPQRGLPYCLCSHHLHLISIS